jgi:phenylacetate-coenzyme A ligase PaaK-like adenylate-forming protein
MEIWETLEFGARALALRATASKPRNEILDTQRSRLQKLVRHARDHSAFYREELAGVDDSSFRLTDLPTTNKSQLMENFDDVVTVDDVRRQDVDAFFKDEANLGKYFRHKYALSHTSGSQGQPLLIVQSKENIELLFALQVSRGNVRLNAWQAVKHLITPARLAAVILKPGFYPSASAFAYIPEGAQQYVELLRLSATDEEMIERLAEFRPTHLTAYASLLHELARHVEAGRLSLQPELQQVINISERLMPQARKHYQKIFGAPILDDYAMGECMFLTNGCPTSGGMHLNADWAILEVVDEDNQPVADGKKGAKVLLTNLANYVQPYIRYEIGDIVSMATNECGCGSNLPLIGRVEGRDSDVFWIEGEDGLRQLQQGVFELAMMHVLDAREFQLVQDDPRRFRVRVEPLPKVQFDRDRAQRVIDEHLQKYGLDGQLQVELEVVDRLAPEGGNKFKRVVSKVSPPHIGDGKPKSRGGKQRAGRAG